MKFFIIMNSILNNSVIFSQIVSFKRKFHNEELQFLLYFFKVTRLHPINIIIRNRFLFFIVKNEDYFNAKRFLKNIRQQLKNFKVLIVREELTLLKLIFSFFQDTYIHDIKLERRFSPEELVITLFFIFDKDRGIAVGNNGFYIKTINYIFNNYVSYRFYHQLKTKPKIKIQCARTFL